MNREWTPNILCLQNDDCGCIWHLQYNIWKKLDKLTEKAEEMDKKLGNNESPKWKWCPWCSGGLHSLPPGMTHAGWDFCYKCRSDLNGKPVCPRCGAPQVTEPLKWEVK